MKTTIEQRMQKVIDGMGLAATIKKTAKGVCYFSAFGFDFFRNPSEHVWTAMTYGTCPTVHKSKNLERLVMKAAGVN